MASVRDLRAQVQDKTLPHKPQAASSRSSTAPGDRALIADDDAVSGLDRQTG